MAKFYPEVCVQAAIERASAPARMRGRFLLAAGVLHGTIPTKLSGKRPTRKRAMERRYNMIDKTKPLPTIEGRDRYPPDGYYDDEPCTCKPDCEFDCKGECNCEACHIAYADSLSSLDGDWE